MTTFLSIHRTEQGAITLDLDTALFGSPSRTSSAGRSATLTSSAGDGAASEPKAPVVPRSIPTTARTTKPKASPKPITKPKASVKRTPKPKASSDKPIYAEIRRLTAEGRHDEAIAMVPSNWPHVIASIEAHRAKHGTPVVEPKAPAAKATRKPKASPKPKAPAKPVSKAKAAVPASRREAKRAVRSSRAAVGNKPQAFPTNVVSEADLVLHWAAAAAAGHLDVVQTAHQLTADQFRAAIGSNDKADAAKLMKRLRNLDNLIRQAV